MLILPEASMPDARQVNATLANNPMSSDSASLCSSESVPAYPLSDDRELAESLLMEMLARVTLT